MLKTDHCGKGGIRWSAHGYCPVRAIHGNITIKPAALFVLRNQVARSALQRSMQTRYALQQIALGRDPYGVSDGIAIAIHDPDAYLPIRGQLPLPRFQSRVQLLQREIENHHSNQPVPLTGYTCGHRNNIRSGRLTDTASRDKGAIPMQNRLKIIARAEALSNTPLV